MKLKIILCMLLILFISGCSDFIINPIPTIHNGEFIPTEDLILTAARGDLKGAFVIHKFGANDEVGTTLEPITISGLYRTPTSAKSLEILSSNNADNVSGTGARTVYVQGLNGTGHWVNESVNMNGTTPTQFSNTYIRVYRFYVNSSGTYANQTASSHTGNITIRETGGGMNWASINVIDGSFGVGQSEIAVYSVPKGYYCLLLSKSVSIDTNRQANIYFFQRTNILHTTAPYSSMRLVQKQVGVSNQFNIDSRTRLDKFDELTDIGYVGETSSGSASISAEFELLCLSKALYENK